MVFRHQLKKEDSLFPHGKAMKLACRKMRPFLLPCMFRDQHKDDFLTFQITCPHPPEQHIVTGEPIGCPEPILVVHLKTSWA